jgi:hypothetical protein
MYFPKKTIYKKRLTLWTAGNHRFLTANDQGLQVGNRVGSVQKEPHLLVSTLYSHWYTDDIVDTCNHSGLGDNLAQDAGVNGGGCIGTSHETANRECLNSRIGVEETNTVD